jgi:hypothetical protein
MTGLERVRACVKRTTPDRTPYLRWDNLELSDFVASWARPRKSKEPSGPPVSEWQDRLTVSPDMWREVFKPRYKAVYDRIHENGLIVFQHSCGFVQDIIADLAEIGVDILELQQLACMDMDVVAQRRGRMVITAPVDIQTVLPTGDWQRIQRFQRRLFRTFDTHAGGYIPQIYCDLATLGVSGSLERRMEELITHLCRWREDH